MSPNSQETTQSKTTFFWNSKEYNSYITTQATIPFSNEIGLMRVQSYPIFHCREGATAWQMSKCIAKELSEQHIENIMDGSKNFNGMFTSLHTSIFLFGE